jgi:hypothetical protein
MADDDWYPSDKPTQRLMYGNIDEKIDGYRTKYPVLTDDYRRVIHTFCQTFIEAYDKIEYNRANGKQATAWFDNLVESKQENTPAPEPPVYLPITLPDGAMVGIEKACRDFAGLMKKQLNYDKADGLSLMIEREADEPRNIADAQPALKISVTSSNAVLFGWKKTGFDALELQWRKVGQTIWQPADKSTVSPIEFTPPLTTPGVPEKFEFRAIYILKNQRVGQWSPVYTETVG